MNSSRPETDQPKLDRDRLPDHVAIIMDGNGRWAKKRLLNRVSGHEKGAETVRDMVRASRKIGIAYLTLYAFSTENWARPKAEVTALMTLLQKFLKNERQELLEKNIRLNAIGQLQRLPSAVAETLQQTMDDTAANDAMTLTLALSYGGREDLVQAARAIASGVRDNRIHPEDISEKLISDHLYTAAMPDPDLLIRTSGEMRISNFLLWQIAYAELHVTDTLWPDFSREEYFQILHAFQNRERRFGNV